MSIQYSGSTLINNTYTSDGTLAGMQSWLISELEAAGWTVSSGSGSDITLVSATTPQGLNIYFRFYNPGTGNCIQITMLSLLPSNTSSIAYFLPVSGVTYRIVANKYQFFAFASGSTYAGVARYNVMGGVPWVPAAVAASIGTYTTCGWMLRSGTSDADTSSSQTFRGFLGSYNPHRNTSSIWRGTLNEYSGDSDPLGVQCELRGQAGSRNCNRLWADGSYKTFEAFIGWYDNTLQTVATVGQIWDAIIVGAQFAGESTYSFDGHTYLAITDASEDYFTLFVAVG
jgi:hypothetical protein